MVTTTKRQHAQDAPLPGPGRKVRHVGFARRLLRGLRNTLRLMLAFGADGLRFARYSGLRETKRRGVLQARIIKSYHRIEKGLALAAPRPGFGADAVRKLVSDANDYLGRYGADRFIEGACAALDEYQRFSLSHGQTAAELEDGIASLLAAVRPAAGGTRTVTRDEIHRCALRDMREFFESRYSVRHFSDEAVSMAEIEAAAAMAQYTPSVCNRQSGHIYVVADKRMANSLLALQNGNRGFGEQADKLLMVTSRLDGFLSVGERNQCWIDGGLFAMSLIYALHSLGLGTCCLNWSVDPGQDKLLRQAAGLPEDHVVIMLLAVGRLPAEFKVAASRRRALDEVLTRLQAEPAKGRK